MAYMIYVSIHCQQVYRYTYRYLWKVYTKQDNYRKDKPRVNNEIGTLIRKRNLQSEETQLHIGKGLDDEQIGLYPL